MGYTVSGNEANIFCIRLCVLYLWCSLSSKLTTIIPAILLIQGGPERMQRLWSLISRTSSIKRNWFLFQSVENLFSNKMTPWSLIWVRRLNPSAILVRQCHFQNLVLFRPHRTLEHNKILTWRPPVALTALALKTKTMWTNGAIHYATVDSPGRREAKHSCPSKDR